MPYRRRGRKTNLTRAGIANRKASAYNRPAKVASVVNLAKQVKRINKTMRREKEMKKLANSAITSSVVGQVFGNSTGCQVAAITVGDMPAGTADGERIGNKVNLKGIMFRAQFQQQSAATAANKVVMEVWRTYDVNTSTATIRNILFDTDSISGVIDANSSYNKDFVGKDAPYVRLARKVIRIKEDTVSGINQYADVKLFIKQNQELLYGGPSLAAPTNVKYFVSLRAVNGNSSSATACTLAGVPITAVNTGLSYLMTHQCWYVDN